MSGGDATGDAARGAADEGPLVEVDRRRVRRREEEETKRHGGRRQTGGRPRRKAPDAPPFTVFLDRDGVFNEHPPLQVRRFEALRWLPGARESFARLSRPDIQTCLVTNQPGTGLGLSTPKMMRRLHAAFRAELQRSGGRLDRIEMCFVPWPLPSRRRKPKAGMLEDGAAALGKEGLGAVDKRRAVMVGDKPKDAQAAAAFGIPAILLGTTTPMDALRQKVEAAGIPYAAIVPGLPEAVQLILSWVDG